MSVTRSVMFEMLHSMLKITLQSSNKTIKMHLTRLSGIFVHFYRFIAVIPYAQ